MGDLRQRIVSHAEKVRQTEELEATLAGVFDQKSQDQRDRFAFLVKQVIQPAFEEFKAVLRQVGKDAVIVSNLTHNPTQSIRLILVDRYLKLGVGKTLTLVNPKDDVTKKSTTKFYEIYPSDEVLFIRKRSVAHTEPVSATVIYADILSQFLENELAVFFEQAYPSGGVIAPD